MYTNITCVCSQMQTDNCVLSFSVQRPWERYGTDINEFLHLAD